MKLKLTYQQFDALYKIFQQLCQKYECVDMIDKMLHVLLTAILIKLHQRSVIRKAAYSIKLAEAEAMCFWEVLHDHKLGNESFEGNLLNEICAAIHQKFA
jgi:hypothetical protein